MTSSRPCALIAVDWGTTTARVYRLDVDGNVIGEQEAPLGIQQVRDAFPAAFAALLGDWIADPAPRLACGMIGSRHGWVEAPYTDCPASLDALARALVRTSDGALTIVPGLICRDDEGVPDVMRGEETQIAGAIEDDSPRMLVVLPGTHSKWAIVRAGSIEAFSTYMTGEVFAVMRDHSILGRMLPATRGTFAAAAFARGVRGAFSSGVTGASFLHRLFGARTLALFGALAPEEIGDYLSGVAIGSEIRDGREWSARLGLEARSVTLVGTRVLCARYAAALAEAGIATNEARRDAAARGLWRIALQAGLIC